VTKTSVTVNRTAINTGKELEESIYDLIHDGFDTFRGQSSSKWQLKPSLLRLLEDTSFVKSCPIRSKEEQMLKRFQACAHLYIAKIPDYSDDLEWFAIMQHHGAPTRLLDVTVSPYIALFFAYEQGYESSSLYAFKTSTMKEAIKQEILSTNAGPSIYYYYKPKILNERMLAQQGLFLVSNVIDEPFEKTLHPESYHVLEIAKDLRLPGIRQLNRMNITSTSLFPGLDGFCRSIKFEVMK
jgi:hypothetical protein